MRRVRDVRGQEKERVRPDAQASLFPAILRPSTDEAIRVTDSALSYRQLAAAAAAVGEQVRHVERIAVWATPSLETVVAVVGILLAGKVVVPLNPNAGERELGHVLADSAPGLVLSAPLAELPAVVAARSTIRVDVHRAGAGFPDEPGLEAPAVIMYTSGTTGAPKGAVLPRRSIMSNLDALAAAWNWTSADTVAHALPLFHVHGLILGTLGPLRLGGRSYHFGRWSAEAVVLAFGSGATMLFAVPTMYHRLVADEGSGPAFKALARARLLVSGSAPLSVADHRLVFERTGQSIVERYGMTETLMSCAVRASGARRPGYVGPPVDGVSVRLVDEAGIPITKGGSDAIGEVEVRGPNLFSGYVNRPDATAAAFRDGWFMTGDVAVRDQDGYLRIIGRQSTDLIKTGGFKVGAGEVESSLLEHPAVSEVAVAGQPDADLGERIAAWVVLQQGASATSEELIDLVAGSLAPYKRPRDIYFVDRLPRNEMGKVLKRSLVGPDLGPTL